MICHLANILITRSLKHTSVPVPSCVVLSHVISPFLLRAYLVYVRPLLEYNSTIWSPHYKYDIDAVERVQQWFTKRLPGLSNYTYNERLIFLNISSLEQRCMRADLILCYKMLFVHLNICSVDFFLNSTSRHNSWTPIQAI